MKNTFGSIWLPLTCCDDSGIAQLYITEKAILKLTKCVDAAEFEQLCTEGRLKLPFFSSIKMLRRPSKPSAVQPGSVEILRPQNNENNFDCFIVDAAEQDMQLLPSTISTKLLPMISFSPEGVLPATLSMIRKSEHYSLAVEYITQPVPEELVKVASKASAGTKILRPCSRAVVLVVSKQRSQPHTVGASGHKLVTSNVVDLLRSDSAPQTGCKYEIVTFCSLDTITDYKLDPPKNAKEQAALISVTGVTDADPDNAEQPIKGFIADEIELLKPEEANVLKALWNQKLYFAALAGQIFSRKRDRETWSSEEHPAQAAQCRVLGKSPTGPELPDYSGAMATA